MRRRAGGRRCGARGRGSQPRTREARGLRPGGIMTPLRGASLDWDCAPWVSGAVCEARQALSRCFKNRPKPGAETRKRGPGACVLRPRPGARSRDGAPRGARVSGNRNAARRKDWCAARCSIPSALCERKKERPRRCGRTTAYPGPVKNTGDGARLLRDYNQLVDAYNRGARI
jgi:hypothetical protein